jgi:hypothetical protein
LVSAEVKLAAATSNPAPPVVTPSVPKLDDEE